jgi:hypothetical protein
MKQSKLERKANAYLAGGVGAGMLIVMLCAALCSFVFTVLSCQIWLSSFSQDAYTYTLVWSVMTFATSWLARKCYYIVKRANKDAAILKSTEDRKVGSPF